MQSADAGGARVCVPGEIPLQRQLRAEGMLCAKVDVYEHASVSPGWSLVGGRM